jgi:aminopeptidase YwaD
MSEVRRRDVLAGAAAFAGFASVGFLPGTAAAATRQRPGTVRPPSLSLGDKAVVSRADARRALEHLRVLSDEIGWRISGTPSEHRAAVYTAKVLRDLGYQVELQPFTVADRYLAELKGHGAHWQCSASPQGAVASARGAIVDLGTATEATADLTGRLALFTRVPGSELAQVKSAVAKGAAAVLIANVAPAGFPERKGGAFTPSLTETVTVPVLGLAQFQGERIRAGVRVLSLEVTHHSGLTSYNVIAERKATLPGPDGGVVMVSAHYDSVPGSPGANDDGSGTVLCLELARALRKLPTQKALRFALWGSEEFGLIGSRHYVSQLSDAEAGRIAGCFQNDMVATSYSPATRYWLLSVDGGDNTTTAQVAAAAGRLGYTDQISKPTARGSSDHVPFFERGIAAANFSWRGEGAPAELEPVYHTPEDTIRGNVSLERLQVSLELIGSAAYEVARHR